MHAGRVQCTEPLTVLASNDSGNFTIQCTFTGYLPSNLSINWMTNESVVMESTDRFSVNTVFGGSGFSQRGGSSNDSGVTSILTISWLTVGMHNFTGYMKNSNLQGSVQLNAGIL